MTTYIDDHDLIVQMTLTRDDTMPMYQRVADAVCEAISKGHYSVGDRLPPHTGLARTLGVSPLTVSKGFELLQHRGIVGRHRGRGTYVESGALRQMKRWGSRQIARLHIVLGESTLANLGRESLFIAVDTLQGVRDVLDETETQWRYVPYCTPEALGDIQKDDAVLVFSSSNFDVAFARQLLESGTLIVSYDQLPGIPGVSYDRRQASSLPCRHLMNCGYQRIGFIGAIDVPNVSQTVKYHTFTSMMQQAGLDVLARDVGNACEAGRAYGVAREMIDRNDLPEAIFVDSDYKAMEVVCALKDAGLKVPDDIGIASYDDITEADRFDPPLTTVRTPRRACGRRAAEMLLEWPTDGTVPQSITLDAELVVRTSTRRLTSR